MLEVSCRAVRSNESQVRSAVRVVWVGDDGGVEGPERGKGRPECDD